MQVCVYEGGDRLDLWGDLQVVQSSWSTQSLRPFQQAVLGVPTTPAYLALSTHQLPPPHQKVPSSKIGGKCTDN